jgi:GDP-4-dehydro-6-deoxy-D-mannose reductase
VSGPTLVVTGATGFVGPHLCEAARTDGYRVIAIGREAEVPDSLASIVDEYVGADLADEWPIAVKADSIVHLAGLAAVGPSFAEPQRYIGVNSAMMTNMGEALVRSGSKARVVIVSSGSVYAPDLTDSPVSELSPVAPTSPYAVAKLLVETQARYYAHRGLDTVVARPFNHIGPGQREGFIVPDLLSSLQATPAGTSLSVGNLDTARDYTDVRDVARAYLTLVAAPDHRHFVYNIASGASRTGREVLEVVSSSLGRPVPPLAVDPARVRPRDPVRITGSAHLLRDEFGWAPEIDWKDSIREYVAERSTI